MTDDAIEQIPEPTPAEARALAVLDRRGRDAAASLTAAVDSHIVDPAEPGSAHRRAGGPGGIDETPLTVELSTSRTRRSRPSVRPWWLAAAAVATVVGLVAAVTLQGDEPPGLSSGGGDVAPPHEPADGGATSRPLDEGQTEVAAGEHDGVSWRLLATRRPGYAALELAYGNGSTGTGWDSGPPPPLEVSWSQSAGRPVPAVFGVVAEGATVTVEVPGRPTVTPEPVELPGWDHQGFVAFVPGVDGVEVVVVARGPDGQEIARDSQPLIAPPAVEDGPPPSAGPEEAPPG
jgi:hypothetical protein